MLVGMAMDADAMTVLVTLAPYATKGVALGLAVGAGALIGAVHYLSLSFTVRQFVEPTGLMPALMVQIGRFAVTGAALAVIAQFGALPLLMATAGVLAARTVAVARLGVRS